VIGGVEQKPGIVAEGEMAVQLLCTGCGRNLKSGIQCEFSDVGVIIRILGSSGYDAI
jgi:hypothetical protein